MLEGVHSEVFTNIQHWSVKQHDFLSGGRMLKALPCYKFTVISEMPLKDFELIVSSGLMNLRNGSLFRNITICYWLPKAVSIT